MNHKKHFFLSRGDSEVVITKMHDKGISLIELVIVLAIISLIITSSIIYPRSVKINNCCRMVCLDLHYARMQAIKERNNYRVIFNLANFHSYKIHDDENNNDHIDIGEEVINKDIHDDFKQL